MVQMGAISRVEEEATTWCAGMVVVMKSGKSVICVDLTAEQVSM